MGHTVARKGGFNMLPDNYTQKEDWDAFYSKILDAEKIDTESEHYTMLKQRILDIKDSRGWFHPALLYRHNISCDTLTEDDLSLAFVINSRIDTSRITLSEDSGIKVCLGDEKLWEVKDNYPSKSFKSFKDRLCRAATARHLSIIEKFCQYPFKHQICIAFDNATSVPVIIEYFKGCDYVQFLSFDNYEKKDAVYGYRAHEMRCSDINNQLLSFCVDVFGNLPVFDTEPIMSE